MAFEIHPLGVRGSYPGSASRPSVFGQDTTCFFVQVGGQGLILDAGSGLTRLDPKLLARVDANSLALLLTHYHLDHLMGFPFFRSPSLNVKPQYFLTPELYCVQIEVLELPVIYPRTTNSIGNGLHFLARVTLGCGMDIK